MRELSRHSGKGQAAGEEEIALCKSHHWLFDHGLISVDSHYHTLVADSIEIEMPANVLRQYHRAPITLPREPEKYPAPAALEWHRENVFGN
ncbi:MAG: hypothetical protein R6W91_02095 [Thermoplasmata archaeon]